MLWSAGRVEEVRSHVKSGLSRGEIAKIYGVTRNAVVGFCYRQGIIGPNNQVMGALVANDRKKRANLLRSTKRPPDKTTRDRWVRKARPMKHEFKLFVAQDEPEPMRTSLLDLGAAHCHWVCEGTDDHCMPTYCGHPAVFESSWCAHHYGRVYARQS